MEQLGRGRNTGPLSCVLMNPLRYVSVLTSSHRQDYRYAPLSHSVGRRRGIRPDPVHTRRCTLRIVAASVHREIAVRAADCRSAHGASAVITSRRAEVACWSGGRQRPALRSRQPDQERGSVKGAIMYGQFPFPFVICPMEFRNLLNSTLQISTTHPVSSNLTPSPLGSAWVRNHRGLKSAGLGQNSSVPLSEFSSRPFWDLHVIVRILSRPS